MYNLKPIIENNLVVELPTCMYTMKSLHLANGNVSAVTAGDSRTADVSEKQRKNPYLAIEQQVKSVLKKSEAGDLEMLEQRQQRILQLLKELKAKLMSMHKDLNLCAKPAQPATDTASGKIQLKPIFAKNLQEIVINANPNSIPYSLLAIKKLWQKRLNLRVKTFTHSTIRHDLATEISTFNEAITAECVEKENAELSVVIIWKAVANVELIYSTASYPLTGEGNILRYLMRIGPNEMCHESYQDECADVDATLDASYMLSNQCTPNKTKQQILKTLNTKLGKQQFFGGSGVSITDIAVCSAIAQSDRALMKEMPAALTKWWTNVAKIVLN